MQRWNEHRCLCSVSRSKEPGGECSSERAISVFWNKLYMMKTLIRSQTMSRKPGMLALSAARTLPGGQNSIRSRSRNLWARSTSSPSSSAHSCNGVKHSKALWKSRFRTRCSNKQSGVHRPSTMRSSKSSASANLCGTSSTRANPTKLAITTRTRSNRRLLIT